MANMQHLQILSQSVDKWNQLRKNDTFKEPDLSHADLNNANLHGVDFSCGINLDGANFRCSNLQNANFSTEIGDVPGTSAIKANFCDADLSGALLYAADFSGANFFHAKLHDVKYVGADSIADVRHVCFENADLRDQHMQGAYLEKVVLKGANLQNTDLSNSVLKYANLSSTNLRNANLSYADLSDAILDNADLSGAKLIYANLNGASLKNSILNQADLAYAQLNQVDFDKLPIRGASFRGVNFCNTTLGNISFSFVNLESTFFSGKTLSLVDFQYANLSGANLCETDLSGAAMQHTNLSSADLRCATLIGTDFEGAILYNCNIYGISAWDVNLKDARQSNLIISDINNNEPLITVDNIEIAQFIFLLLKNENVRSFIDTITMKIVLILGRFSKKRKNVLDSIREELKKYNYVPIICDFSKPSNRSLTETVRLLAHLARFIIADLSDAKCVPQELEAIIPFVKVPIKPILDAKSRLYGMFKDFYVYNWVLGVYRYSNEQELIENIYPEIIQPAEEKACSLTNTCKLSK